MLFSSMCLFLLKTSNGLISFVVANRRHLNLLKKKKKALRGEVEDFVESHLCKVLMITSVARTTGCYVTSCVNECVSHWRERNLAAVLVAHLLTCSLDTWEGISIGSACNRRHGRFPVCIPTPLLLRVTALLLRVIILLFPPLHPRLGPTVRSRTTE